MNRLTIALCFIISLLTVNAKDMDGIIDIHSHIITPEYLDCLRRHDALMEDGYPLPEWSEKSHLEFMDSMGIAKSVLTLSSPQPWFGDIDESKRVIRSVNEAMSETQRHCPDRFLWCAALPQPDVSAAIDEAIYALDTLKADGIKLATNVAGQYLGDPALDPLMAELDKRNAIVILHPVKPAPVNEDVFTGGPIFVYEYPAETTRAVLNMIAHDVMVRYPNIKFVMPHAASFLPYAIPRLKGGYPLLVNKGITKPFDIDGNLKNLYYDLAGGPSAETMRQILSITSPDHIMYGSDFSFVPGAILEKVRDNLVRNIESDPVLRPYKEMFLHENAEKIFGLKSDSEVSIPKIMCEKEQMQSDGIIRLSKVEVYPEYLEEYMTYATTVGETSLLTEPGVLTMYAVADKINPNIITILETYSSQEAYRSHIASTHFQKYKQGTLHMVKNLALDDVSPLNPRNQITNTIE